MPRLIEDIRRRPQKAPEKVTGHQDDDHFFEPQVQKETKHKSQFPKISKKAKYFFSIFFIILILFAFAAFALFTSSKKMQAKVSEKFLAINKEVSSLQSGEYSTIFSSASELKYKIKSATLDVQALGQDLIIFNFINQKSTSSRENSLISMVLAADRITSSYFSLINQSSDLGTKTDSSDYISIANGYLKKIVSKLSSLKTSIKFNAFNIENANWIIKSTEGKNLTSSEFESWQKVVKLSESASDSFDQISKIPDSLLSALGQNTTEKKYILMFQNNTELRPSGGFMGSFAVATFRDGKLQDLNFEKNIYDLDNRYKDSGGSSQVPDELIGETNEWYLRDINWSADFYQTAKLVQSQYEKESGVKTDGTIAIDTSMITDLLKITGPIELKSYEKTISDSNFLSEIQYFVEVDYFDSRQNSAENQPKKILADMMPLLIQKLTKSDGKKVFSVFQKSIEEKHLLLAFNDSNLEKVSEIIGADCRIENSSQDYLQSVSANIFGMKSSMNVKETIDQSVKIDPKGIVNEQLTITRNHTGNGVWPDNDNNNLMMIYLPFSSKLESVNIVSDSEFPTISKNLADGKSYNSKIESGKLKVYYWQTTKVGSKSKSVISYNREQTKMADGDGFDYQITVQKQPGVINFDYNLNIVYPEGYKPLNIEKYDAENRQISLNFSIVKDTDIKISFIKSESK